MKKQNQVRRNGSPAAAAPQRKSAYTKAGAGHQPTANGDAPSGFCLFDGAVGMEVCKLPLVRAQMDSVVKAVMIRGISVDQFISEAISEKLTRTPGTSARPEAVSPNGAVTVLLFDRDKEEEIEQFDLTNAEFSRIRDAIAKTVDRPVDGAAVAAFVRESLLHSANRELLPGYSPTNLGDAHDRLELAASAAVAAISVLSDAYFEAIDSANEYQRKEANGLISLAHHASCQLETECELALHEWMKAR
jgi:hypothetical protein